MNREQKRKLGVLAALGLALLVSGTFAFTAFNQRAINDRLRDNEVEVGGRVHDYYNRDTENKDVFVENYGQNKIMARIRLSEFMAIQERGQSGFEPLVPNTVRDQVDTWTIWKPSATDLDNRQGDSNLFDQYSNLTFGWERNGQFAPWYLPTFNHVENDPRTAAAGHARDWAEVDGDTNSGIATDGVTDGATHPGDGTDAYWSEGQSYNNAAGDWFGSQVEREVAQHLEQERSPMTMDQWEEDLDREEKIGDFWVIDHNTGWAYWASKLQVGETTSYLLDAAQMTEQANDINGSYYYGIHVSSHLVIPDRREDFLATEGEEQHHERLADFLEGIENNAMDEEASNGGGLPAENPEADENAGPGDFNFGIMNPGRLFTMEGQQFRYLENMGDGNHLIIREEALRNVSWNDQETRLTSWYGELPEAVRAIVAPVAPSFTVGMITGTNAGVDVQRWLVNNLDSNLEVANDRTEVVPVEEGGIRRAFALSLADVYHLSRTEGIGFPNLAQRVGGNNSWWWLRTPYRASPVWDTAAWAVNGGSAAGQFHARNRTTSAYGGGVRPALILHQAGT